MHCISLLLVMHCYYFNLQNQLFLAAMLVPVKCVGVYRRECIFDYYGEADVFTYVS